MNFFQLTLTAGIATMAFALSSCDDAQSDVSATFDANVATVAHAFADFQAEDEHFFTHFSEDAYWAGTSLNAPDSIALADVAPMYRELWGKYDYTRIAEPNFLPGVNPESKETDGSVRGYFKWNITCLLYTSDAADE